MTTPKAKSCSNRIPATLTRSLLSLFIQTLLKEPDLLAETDAYTLCEKLAEKVLGIPYNENIPTSLRLKTTPASSKRIIGDLRIFEMNATEEDWERMYQEVMEPKYKKETRKFSREITGNPYPADEEAPIFLIPREKGVSSYLETPLADVANEDVQYCPISKGFTMQDVSSFSLGPVYQEGLCVVNAAFAKSITVAHLEGGGVLDLSRKNYWRRARRPPRQIEMLSSTTMQVDGKSYKIVSWLRKNEELWLADWQLWSRCVALTSRGDFDWTAGLGEVLAYKHRERYLSFPQWKTECYIRFGYDLIPNTDVYHFLTKVWKKKRIPLGLVHPMASSEAVIKPVTRQLIKKLMVSPDEMICMPYVIAGLLMQIAPPLLEK